MDQTKPKITEKDLINSFYRSNQQRYELVAPNVYPCWRFKEMDIMAVRPSGFVDEIEIKLTKADFKADFRKIVNISCEPYHKEGRSYLTSWEEKNKHECLVKGLNHCNYFSFLMPKELAEKCDIPNYAGLYVYNNGWITERKKPKRLHNRKISLDLKYHIARKMAFRFWHLTNQ